MNKIEVFQHCSSPATGFRMKIHTMVGADDPITSCIVKARAADVGDNYTSRVRSF